MPKLFLVRHGTTEYNATRRFAGSSDIDMVELGYRQIEKLRERLVRQQFGAVYTSTRQRAIKTGQIICQNVDGCEVVACPELDEISYGECEGLTFKEINERFPVLGGNIRFFNPQLEFPGGESFPAFIERVVSFLSRIEKHVPSDNILVVSHSGPIRVLLNRLLGIGYEHWWQFNVANASLSIVDTYPQGGILSLLNDTSHLKDL